jgi:hypothetical protein
MTFPVVRQPSLPTSTVIPVNEDLFIPYLSDLYEQIASAVNSKDPNYFTTAITDVPTNIPNVPNFGAFIICVSGKTTSLPTLTASLCKASASNAGSIAVLGSQAGTGTWAANTLTITATATNFQIAHNKAATSGNFNIRIIGTQ